MHVCMCGCARAYHAQRTTLGVMFDNNACFLGVSHWIGTLRSCVRWVLSSRNPSVFTLPHRSQCRTYTPGMCTWALGFELRSHIADWTMYTNPSILLKAILSLKYFKLNLYTCAHGRTHTHLHLSICTSSCMACGGQRLILGVCFQLISLCDGASDWIWKGLIWLDCLSSEFHGSSCLCPKPHVSTEVVGTHFWDPLFIWVMDVQTQVSLLAWSTLYKLCHLSIRMYTPKKFIRLGSNTKHWTVSTYLPFLKLCWQ